MTRSDPALLVTQMTEAARRATSYVEGLDKEAFLQDTRTQEAAAMNLLAIGELVSKLMRLHADLLGSYPQLPWEKMKGMRNRIAHGYFELNMSVVWETVTTWLPEFLHHAPQILAEAERSRGADRKSPKGPS